jgi:hypothetical protein
MTTATATTWPTMAELRESASQVEKAGHLLDRLDVRLHALVKDGDRPSATLEDVGALAQFIEMCEMDISVMKDGLEAARAALHLASGDVYEANRAR